MRVSSNLLAWAGSWESLLTPSSPPTHQFEWVRACAEQFADPSELSVLMVGTPEQPRAVAPLVLNRGAFRRLELLGVRELHEPTGLIYKNASDAAQLAGEMAQLGFPLAFDRVMADSLTLAAIRDAWRGRGLVVCRPSQGYPFLALDDAW